MVKIGFISLFLAGFIFISVFSIFVLVHDGNGFHKECFISFVKGISCPANSGAAYFVIFHLDLARKFSEAVLGGGFAAAVSLFAAMVLLAGLTALFGYEFVLSSLPQNFCRRILAVPAGSPYKKEFADWLAIHTNSPALI